MPVVVAGSDGDGDRVDSVATTTSSAGTTDENEPSDDGTTDVCSEGGLAAAQQLQEAVDQAHRPLWDCLKLG